jgi:septum formation protein
MKLEIRDPKSKIPLVLASSSPRRRELLSSAGIAFNVVNSDIPEEQQPGEGPIAFARRLAREKAEAVLRKLQSHAPVRVLGADTIVVVDGQVLGKPQTADDARRMLQLLSGRTHEVVTAVCIITRNEQGSVTADLRHATTVVRFHQLSESEISAYIATGEPLDKAGAYGIQGAASPFIAGYDGDYNNVVGLPVDLVREMLAQ